MISLTELDGSKTTYTYDDLGRLSSAVRTGTAAYNQSYQYDLDDNLTKLTSGGVATSATYDADNQIISFWGTSYTYDRDGNLTSFGSNTLSYDASGHWTGGTVSSKSLDMGYDGLGRRVYRTVGTSRQDYWYDQSGLVKETGGTNVTYLRTPSGRPLSRYVTVPYDYSLDRLGSVTMMTTTGQGSAGTYTYDPWGSEVGSSATTYNPIRYTGSHRDSSTSMYQMGARYYDPSPGRFTQPDPLSNGAYNPKGHYQGGKVSPTDLQSGMFAQNRYSYVNCNPANDTDPTGLLSECATGVIDTLVGIAGVGVGLVSAPETLGLGLIGVGLGLVSFDVGMYETKKYCPTIWYPFGP